MRRYLSVATVCALFAGASDSSQGDKKAEQPKMDVPLVVVLKSSAAKYPLDLGGKTGKEFLADLDAALKKGGPIPKPPAVKWEIEVRNQGREKVEFWASGDPVVVELELKGPGAKTIRAPVFFTADFRMPKPMTLEPGKSHKMTFKSLMSGFRGASVYHYWTEPGEYTLTARLLTGIRPVPPGTKEFYGAGKVTLTSNTIKVKVK